MPDDKRSVTAGEGVKAIVAKMAQIYDTIKWVTCPACKKDWTGLGTYQFALDGNYEKREVCLDCGETPRGLLHVAQEFPKGLTIVIHGKADYPKGQWATVTYGEAGIKLSIWHEDTRLKVYGAGVPEPTYDHVYRAYFELHELIDRVSGASPQSNEWGGQNRRQTTEKRAGPIRRLGRKFVGG